MDMYTNIRFSYVGHLMEPRVHGALRRCPRHNFRLARAPPAHQAVATSRLWELHAQVELPLLAPHRGPADEAVPLRPGPQAQQPGKLGVLQRPVDDVEGLAGLQGAELAASLAARGVVKRRAPNDFIGGRPRLQGLRRDPSQRAALVLARALRDLDRLAHGELAQHSRLALRSC